MHHRTKSGEIVPKNTIDHHKDNTSYQRFNKKVATWLTNNVGTMTCYWVFTGISLVSLPAILVTVAAGVTGFFPHWLIAAGLIALIQWLSSNYLQLTLLPALMVGQNLQSAASDIRSTKTFEDTEKIIDLLDIKTQGGIQEIYARIDAFEDSLNDKLGSGNK